MHIKVTLPALVRPFMTAPIFEASLAKEQGQLSKAVDLVMKIANDRELDNGSNPSWMNDFLSEIVSLSVKKKTPRDATYAISKMTQTLGKAKAFRLLGEYYGTNQDTVKSKEAFTQSVKQLKSVDNSNEKVRTSLLLAESVFEVRAGGCLRNFSRIGKSDQQSSLT